MKRGCLIVSLVVVVLASVLITIFIYDLSRSFDPVYDTAEIKQDIGGTLICNSIYIADHHSWQYDVTYKYKLNNDSLIEIGSGTYYGREWNKDEQLIQYKNWTILKTGGIATDKLIIGNIRTKEWKAYEFTPHIIEADSLWIKLSIPSHSLVCCPETSIERISNGQILLNYKFRTSEKDVDEYQQRKIYYTIDEATGKPTMARIDEPSI